MQFHADFWHHKLHVQLKRPVFTIIIIIIIILSCLTSLDSSKPIQKIISVSHKGLSTPITT